MYRCDIALTSPRDVGSEPPEQLSCQSVIGGANFCEVVLAKSQQSGCLAHLGQLVPERNAHQGLGKEQPSHSDLQAAYRHDAVQDDVTNQIARHHPGRRRPFGEIALYRGRACCQYQRRGGATEQRGGACPLQITGRQALGAAGPAHKSIDDANDDGGRVVPTFLTSAGDQRFSGTCGRPGSEQLTQHGLAPQLTVHSVGAQQYSISATQIDKQRVHTQSIR